MSAILPPSDRLWYKHPIDRVEGTWLAIALVWCLILLGLKKQTCVLHMLTS